MRVKLDHAIDKVLGLYAHFLIILLFVLGPLDLTGFDITVHRHWVLAFEGHHANEHLEQDAAEGPRVHRTTLSLAVDHFRRLVVDSTDESVPPLSVALLLFLLFLIDFSGVSEVDDLDIVVLIEHDVLRLQISVHHPFLL